MKVLIVTNMYPTQEHPGLGTFVKTQAESLTDAGVQIEVQFVNGVASRWNYLKGIFELQRRLGECSYDLIHAHYGF
ncbi:MAG: glycosyltransferase family 4 protein, partial [bacterium]|nr:glycosyltransferase family 4 protein [bacterium]